jgi:hypothetical protein
MARATGFLLLFLVASSAGCLLAGSRRGSGPEVIRKGPAPDWVSGPSSRYPKTAFLTGVGTAESREPAEEDARAELARIFQADVSSRVSAYEKYFQVRGGGNAQTTDEVSLANLTTVSTRMVLEGSEVVEVFKQKGTGQYYALAVLDRSKSARILRDRILRLDDETTMLLQSADGASDKLAQLKYLKRSVPKFVLRDAYDTQLRIVDPAGGGVPGQANAEGIKTRIEHLLAKEVSIGVSVTGAGVDELRARILTELGALGLPVVPDRPGGEFDLRLDVRSTFKVTRRSQGFVDAHWEVRSRLLDRTGKELKTTVLEASGGYVDQVQAEGLMLAEVKGKVPAALARQVDDYLLDR